MDDIPAGWKYEGQDFELIIFYPRGEIEAGKA